jgi:hypothetical protein
MRTRRSLATARTATLLAVTVVIAPGWTDLTYVTLPPASIGASWTMPWQLSPASDASRAQGEVTLLADVPGYGRVRGTTTALQYLFSQLPEQPGRNTIVEACRDAIGRSAAKFGTVQVEASSAGPERRTPDGYSAPVSFRLIYARFNGREDYEIRQTTLTCTANRSGQILDARA